LRSALERLTEPLKAAEFPPDSRFSDFLVWPVTASARHGNVDCSNPPLNKTCKQTLRWRRKDQQKDQQNVDDLPAKVCYTEAMRWTSRTQTSALVVARPGLMRNSLLTFLQSTPHIKVVALLDDPAATLEAVRRHRPHTLVVDADLSEQVLLAVVRKLGTEQPTINSVVLVDSLRQRDAFLSVGGTHTHVLLKGCLGERLQAAIQDGAGKDSETMIAE